MSSSRDVLLPVGTRLVHIGPHKTGTTAVQSAFHGARREAEAQGVQYAGPNRQPLRAVQAAVARGTRSEARRPARAWLQLVGALRHAKAQRVVISSEMFADAKPPAIEALVHDLGRQRVHVVATLRPLAAIVPSQWQQFVQSSMPITFDQYLEEILHRPSGAVAMKVWHRHRHDQLIERWAAAVGRDHVSVVVADDRDRGAILRAFEQLVGLRPGTLVSSGDRSNRSLTRPESELVRRLNADLLEARVDGRVRLNTVLFGAAVVLKRRVPPPDEARIETPEWAVPEIARIANEVVAGITASGVRVIGDLTALLEAPPPHAAPEPDSRAAEVAWPEIAAASAMGVLLATGHGRTGSRTAPAAWEDGIIVTPAQSTARLAELPGGAEESADLDSVSTRRLQGTLYGRVRRAIRLR